MMQGVGESADAVELVEDIGAWCGFCGDPLELGQEVVVHGGARCHWDDFYLEPAAPTRQESLLVRRQS